jgi:hypothetical protein
MEERMTSTNAALTQWLRGAAAAGANELFAEIPTTVRRLGLLFVALAISVPLFLAGCLTVLVWLLFT